MNSFQINTWIVSSMSVFTTIMLAVCLYFILSYFEHLKQDNKRLIKQSKFLAVISLLLVFGIPAFYQLYVNLFLLH